jgi:hypothetical protein
VWPREILAAPFGLIAWHKLSKLIEFFVMMGCVLNEVPRHLEGPDGAHPIRYLYSPKTNDFVSLLNYENDEYIPPSEVENWERRLGFEVPPAQLS